MSPPLRSPLRVLIDASYAQRAPRSGTGVYTERLLAALRDLPELEVRAVADGRRGQPGGGGLRSARNLAADLAWQTIGLPRLARRWRADAVHHTLPAHAVLPGCAQVVTVHDLAVVRHPELFDPRFARLARVAHRRAARAADAVLAVSESTAADMRSLWGVSPGRIVLARHGPGQFGADPASPDAGPPIEPGAGPLRKPDAGPSREPGGFLLYVGDDEPRKDLDALLAAHARLRAGPTPALELILAGRIPAHRCAGPGVRCAGEVGPARLRELIAGALALVHPARHEGFGLTVLEAMAAGTPVVAARSAAIAELCGETALLVAPGEAHALAAAIARLQIEPGLAQRLARLARERAAGYSWAASARAHAAAYSLAVGTRGRRRP